MTENKPFIQSPRSATYNATLANAASTLQAAFNDLLRSPTSYAVACPMSPSVFKPLPGRPRSSSLPLLPELPVELPGSILQDNQGFPSLPPAEDLALFRPISQNVRRSTHPVIQDIEDEEDFSELLRLFPEPLIHAKSVPDFGHPQSDMRSSRSGNTFDPDVVPKPNPLRVQHKKSLSGAGSGKRLRPNLMTSSPSTNSKLATCPAVAVGCSSAVSAITEIDGSKTLQSSPPIVEGQAWNSNAEHRVSRRSEASTICFLHVVCLFIKQDAMHNETVSDNLALFPRTPIRHVMPEVKIFRLIRSWHSFLSAHSSLCNMTKHRE
jgi:hypothetical protein